jgi:hypothetical protein
MDSLTGVRASPEQKPGGGRFLIAKNVFQNQFKKIQSLRNHLAHANDYAASPEAAIGNCKTVRLIDEWNDRLSKCKMLSQNGGHAKCLRTRSLPPITRIIGTKSNVRLSVKRRHSSAPSGCRPRAKVRHEPIYSITSSALTKNDSGRVTPIALDVFKLTVNSNLVGCSTGMFSGLAPRRNAVSNLSRTREKRRKIRSIRQESSGPNPIVSAVYRW